MIINKHIKKAIIYIFLCAYGFALIKPVTPIINDVIAHTFYKMEHLATVHFENGKYHVHAELASESDQQKNNAKGTTPVSIYDTLANHLYSEVIEFKIYSSPSLKIILPKTEHPHDAFRQHSTPPPEA